MVNLKRDKGITLTALVVMIIVIIILAGVSIAQGTDLIKHTKIENYVTNMITIRAKAKIYAEEVNAETWDASDKATKKTEIFAEKYKMTKSSNEKEIINKLDSNVNTDGGYECYEITTETLNIMGLNEMVKDTYDGEYVVVYDANDYKNLDIVYVDGIEYNKTIYYTLSKLQGVIEEK